MDVDLKEKVPAARSGSRHNKTDSKLSGTGTGEGGGDGDFFSSKDHTKDINMDRDANTASTTAQDGLDANWLQSHDVDLVEKTVEGFRNQRLSMVQSLRQYVLCYESVMEWLAEQSPLEGEAH